MFFKIVEYAFHQVKGYKEDRVRGFKVYSLVYGDEKAMYSIAGFGR